MAEIYKQILALRDSNRKVCKNIQTAVEKLLSKGYVCNAGVKLSASQGVLELLMWLLDVELCQAYGSAAMLAGKTGNLSTKKFPINKKQASKSSIQIDYSHVDAQLQALQQAALALHSNDMIYTLLLFDLKQMAQNVDTKDILDIFKSSVSIIKKSSYIECLNNTIKRVKAGKKAGEELCQAVQAIISQTGRVIASFQKADQKMRQQIADIRAKNALKRSKGITDVTSKNAQKAKEAKQELEAAQAEYVAVHGKPSEEIQQEIARLDKELAYALWVAEIERASKSKNNGGEVGKVGADYGQSSGWCDYFVLWMLRRAGMEDLAKSLGRGCRNQVSKAKQGKIKGGTWKDTSYTPKTGDLVYFGPQGGTAGHVGIVYVKENGETWLLHGNFKAYPSEVYCVTYQKWNPKAPLGSQVTLGYISVD